MKTTEEMISIMRAFAEGKKIECRRYGCDNWYIAKAPCWDWSSFDYRVKPESPKKKIVPYESAEEFLQAQKEHGMYIRFKGWKGMPIIVDDNGIQVIDTITYDRLIHYCFLDGTPCGKEVEE